MSCFDDLIVDLRCPVTGKEEEQYVQLFIRKSCVDAKTYHVGSYVELDKDNSSWFSTDYVCDQCSKKTKGKYRDFIKTEDQSRHNCYIHLEHNKILEVITEEEFASKGIERCLDQDEYDFN